VKSPVSSPADLHIPGWSRRPGGRNRTTCRTWRSRAGPGGRCRAWGGIVLGSAVPASVFTFGVLAELDQVTVPVTSIAPGPRHPAAFC